MERLTNEERVVQEATPLLVGIPNYYIKSYAGTLYCISTDYRYIINISNYGNA